MPAKTPRMQRFMGMCSTDEGRAKAQGACPPVDVAKEFARKPKGGYAPNRKSRSTKERKTRP